MSSSKPSSSLLSKPPPAKRSFVDESTECAICYDPLEEGTTTTRRPVITLKCGHKWHLDCIVQQIKIGSMTASNDDMRLLFNGCQCGKCGSIFGEDDHPDLPKDLIRSTDKLRSKVNALMDEHNLLEGLPTGVRSKRCDGSSDQDQRKEALYKKARRKYAFYLCIHCKDPYFGGTIECADGLRSQGESSSGEATRALPETRLCPACAPQSQTICRNPSEHGRYLTWKCRYCCTPSTTVCYGNVHFCDDCHDKNSDGAATLEAIPCPGDSCGYPKQPREESSEHGVDSNHHRSRNNFHSNGPSQDCEQVYSCVLCDSLGGETTTNGNHHDPLAIEAGSRNFLVNPSGEDGLEGWRQLNPRMSWRVEQQGDREDQIIPPLLETPVIGRNHENGTTYFRPPITTNFVSSFLDCGMEQTVDLSEVLRLGIHNNSNTNNNEGRLLRGVRIEVSARYTGRTDCPSVFALEAILWDDESATHQRERNNNSRQHQRRRRTSPPQRLSSGTLEAPPGVYWERTSLEFVLDTISVGTEWNRPMVTVRVFGKDRRFWQGNFGSKVANITVRVVGGTGEEIDALVNPPGEVPGAFVGNGFGGDNNGNNNNNNDEATTHENRGSFSSAVDPFRSTISPQPGTKPAPLGGLGAGVVVIVVLLLSWLFSKGS
jgi:hypothetical protein